MSQAVKLSSKIIDQARVVSKALNRSLAGQIEYWAKIGKIAEENPEMNYEFIKNILISKQEINKGKLFNYEFDD
ncbi:MAG: hypothetical protein GY830_04880 [Bacteroidetes bacterium]|nr:hypothetical protein [Bacteroidota bacterium]